MGVIGLGVYIGIFLGGLDVLDVLLQILPWAAIVGALLCL